MPGDSVSTEVPPQKIDHTPKQPLKKQGLPKPKGLYIFTSPLGGQGAGLSFHSLHVAAGGGIHFYFVAYIDEQWHFDFGAGFNSGIF